MRRNRALELVSASIGLVLFSFRLHWARFVYLPQESRTPVVQAPWSVSRP